MILIVLPDVADDNELLQQARNFNKDAVRVIYERYFPPIYQFIRLRINNRELARDIAADVFLDFMVALRGSNPPRTSLRGWLFRVARNKIYQQYGKQQKFPETTLEEWTPHEYEHSPEAQLLSTQRVERLRRTLAMLVPEQQEVIILRYGQGLNLQATADVMDKSVSAIKSLQFRAIQNLRDLMDVGEEA